MHNTNAERDLERIAEQLSEVIRLLVVIANQNTRETTPTSRRKRTNG